MNSKSTYSLVKTIGTIAKQSQKLAALAVKEYTPEVDSIINGKCRDTNRIELLLDYMLDFGFDKGMLALYKKLCRYLYTIDQTAAIAYVGYYREMWDSEKTNRKPPRTR